MRVASCVEVEALLQRQNQVVSSVEVPGEVLAYLEEEVEPATAQEGLKKFRRP